MQNGKTLPTTVPLNLYLIFVEDIVVFLSLKVLSTDNYAFFPLVEKTQVTYCRETTIENKHFFKL